MGAGWGRGGTCRRDAQSMGMVNCSDTGPTPRRTPAAPRPSSSVARTRSAASLPPATLRSFHTSFRARSCQSQLCARAPHMPRVAAPLLTHVHPVPARFDREGPSSALCRLPASNECLLPRHDSMRPGWHRLAQTPLCAPRRSPCRLRPACQARAQHAVQPACAPSTHVVRRTKPSAPPRRQPAERRAGGPGARGARHLRASRLGLALRLAGHALHRAREGHGHLQRARRLIGRVVRAHRQHDHGLPRRALLVRGELGLG